MAAYISFDILQNSVFNNIFCFEKALTNFPYYTATFLVYAHRFGVQFPKLQIFSEIFWTLHIDYSQYEKAILEIFIYLFIYEVTTTKIDFRFQKQCSQAATRLT